jgi:SAM-dependent methyltransferase
MNKQDQYFQTRLSYEPKRDAIWKPIVRYLQRYVPENAKILELGAGYCSFINQIEGVEKHALDKSNIIKNYASADVKTHIQDCTNLGSFHTGYFDAVFSSFLFEHLSREQLNTVLKHLRRIIRKDGVIITLLPNFKLIYRHYFDDYTHLQVFSHVSFADFMVSQGFEVSEVQARFLPYSFKSKFPKSALLTSLYLRLKWRPFAGNMLIVARNPEIFSPPPERDRVVHRRFPEREKSAPIPTSVLKDTKRHGEPRRQPPAPGRSPESNSSEPGNSRREERHSRYNRRPRHRPGPRTDQQNNRSPASSDSQPPDASRPAQKPENSSNPEQTEK